MRKQWYFRTIGNGTEIIVHGNRQGSQGSKRDGKKAKRERKGGGRIKREQMGRHIFYK
jgi:hypothetical protein